MRSATKLCFAFAAVALLAGCFSDPRKVAHVGNYKTLETGYNKSLSVGDPVLIEFNCRSWTEASSMGRSWHGECDKEKYQDHYVVDAKNNFIYWSSGDHTVTRATLKFEKGLNEKDIKGYPAPYFFKESRTFDYDLNQIFLFRSDPQTIGRNDATEPAFQKTLDAGCLIGNLNSRHCG
jgi:hypothetical protein